MEDWIPSRLVKVTWVDSFSVSSVEDVVGVKDV